ncbi:MAG: TIGR02117 family protein [Cyanobacteria bacterium P01_G01_bin.4]
MRNQQNQALSRSNYQLRWMRWSRQLVRWALGGLLLFLAVLLVGLIPVNNGFSPTTDGVEVAVVSNAVHADIIVPVRTDDMDWLERFDERNFPSDVSAYSHVAIGWGDRGFFLETPTLADLNLSTAVNALFLPSRSCLHVTFTRPERFDSAPSVTITSDQYKDLVAFVQRSLTTSPIGNPTGHPISIPGYSYSSTDTFFEAHGTYHLFNTCNSWAGQALKAAGIRAPWLSPLPKTPAMYLPNQ